MAEKPKLSTATNMRLGKSTDATAFRRSLVINSGVLKSRENSSPNIDKSIERSLPEPEDGEVIT